MKKANWDNADSYPLLALFMFFPLAFCAYWYYCRYLSEPVAIFYLEPAKWFIIAGLASVFLNNGRETTLIAAGAGIVTYAGAYCFWEWVPYVCLKLHPFMPHFTSALLSKSAGWVILRIIISMAVGFIIAVIATETARWAGGWEKAALKFLTVSLPESNKAVTTAVSQANVPQTPQSNAQNTSMYIPGVDIYMNPRPNPAALDKVIGLEKAKQIAVNAIKMAMDSKVYAEYGLTPPGGLLLYGPPGTGKTSFARACAEALGCTFYVVNASSLLGSLVGQSEQAVRNLFAHARAHRPAIIFWDEIDAVGQRRDGMNLNRPSDLILNILLAEMDGFNAKGEKGVLVIGATNRIDVLDEALLRPGRFDFKVEVGLPGFEDRVKLLQFFLKGRKTEGITAEGLKEIAGQTEGWSPADLKALVDEAAWRALERNEPITADAFKAALEQHNY